MCVGCRVRQAPSELVRLVVDGDGALQVDLRQRLSGRGAYLHAKRACVELALRRRALQRSLGALADPGPADELLVRLRTAVETRLLERLGLARRAGAVVAGTAAVRRAMKQNEARHVCVAVDASDATRDQIVANCRRKGISVSNCVRGAHLAKAVGLDHVSALAVTGEPFATDLSVLSTCLEAADESPGGGHE